MIGDVIEDIIVLAPQNRITNTDNQSSIHSTPGGSGANFAVWLASLGIQTSLIARVSSKDKERLDQYFKSAKVEPLLEIDQESETGRIVVLVEGNHRTFFTDRAANLKLVATQVPPADLLYVSGYSVLSLGVGRTKQLIKNAKEQGALVAIDPGSTSFIKSFGVDEFLEAIQGADLIFPNQEEFELLSRKDLSKLFPEVAITKGDQGAEVLGVGQVSAKQVESVDPTGAGDAFAAMYSAMKLEGKSPFEALEQANAFASEALRRVGGGPS